QSNFILDRNKDGLTEEEKLFLDDLSDEEIKLLIEECSTAYNYFNALQDGLKLSLNSIYGALGNKTFVCSTKDIANAITTMSRDTIKLMDRTNEKYWYRKWHNDTEIHKMLGITKVEKIPE